MSQVRTITIEPNAIKSDGTIVPVEPGVGLTLGIGTYYVMVNGSDSPVESIHVWGNASVVATSISFQDSNMPRKRLEGDTDDVTDINATAGLWITEDPSTAYVPITGAGWTVTNMTVAVAGGAVGGFIWNLGNLGTRRGRVKMVLTTGGVMRVAVHGKS